MPLASAIPSLPPITWLEVTASSGDGRYLELVTPAITYPGAEVRLYLEHGKPAIGVFRPIAPDLPAAVARIAAQPAASLVGIVSIDIMISSPTAAQQVGLVIEIDDRAHTLDPTALAALPDDKRGWPVAAVIATIAPDLHPTRIRVVGETEQVIDLGAPNRQATLKLTHSGAYVFRVWENGRAVVDVRPLTRIVVE